MGEFVRFGSCIARELINLQWFCTDSEQTQMINYQFNADREAAGKAIGIAAETVRQWERKGQIPPHCYTKIGHRAVRYCLALLNDWVLDPDDMEARAWSIESLNATRPSQQPRKSGQKVNTA